jgi:hypothetical protein
MPRRSQVDRPLAEALARGETQQMAAEAARCSLNTVKRRWAEPAFRRLVHQIQQEQAQMRQALLYSSWTSGIKLLSSAHAALRDALQDPTASHLDRARAARVVLRAYGPREEPPAPFVPTVEQEQEAAAAAAKIRQLIAQTNVVDLDTRRPPPPRPAPVAGEASWTPPPPAWPIDDDEDDEEEEDAAGVGQEYTKTAPAEPLGPPEPPPEVAESPDDDDDDTDPAEELPAAAQGQGQPWEIEGRWVSEGGDRAWRTRQPPITQPAPPPPPTRRHRRRPRPEGR